MKKLYILTAAAGLALTTLPAFGVGFTVGINESNPGAVVISSSIFSAKNSDSATTANFGVDLVNFLTSAATINSTAASSSTFAAFVSGPVLNSFESDTLDATGGSKLDLNLFSSSSSAAQTFTGGTQAFTGTETINLSAFAADLPALNTSGSIYTGDSSGGSGTMIATWIVTAGVPVPEPTTIALAGLGFAGLMTLRRKR